MQVFVQGGAIHAINVSEETTFNQLKSELVLSEGITVEDQVLSYGGVPLEDDTLVCETVPELATLSLAVRVVGGKVHGSLARAGKVRGQTPKVEAQEKKKKKKTGRAKRRMQYNRRFVNVVAQFGRRRGPNSNAPQ